jgi:hypothetical protein
MISRIYFLKQLSVFLFSSFIFACGIDDAGTPPNNQTQTQTPLISAHPQGAEYIQGTTAALSVTARVGKGSLTYQWYSNTANSNSGGVPIVGETSPIYTLPTGTLGTFYYYVVVTNTDSADSASAYSAISNVAVINIIPVQAVYIPIYNAADLYNIRHNLSANYRLMNNISLSGYSTGPGWEPIGSCAVSADVPFSGSLDGGGYRITDLYINTAGTFAGIFGCLTGRVDNLGVEIAAGGVNSSSSRSSYAGGIAGYVDGGTVTNSYSTGSVSSASTASSSSSSYSSYTGGIAGYVDGGTVTGSYSTGRVSSSSSSYSSYAGGIAGYADVGTVSGSYSTGNVSSTSTSSYSSYAGGIAGYADGGTVSGSHSTGVIFSSSYSASYAGGIAGYLSGTVSGSHSIGGVSSTSASPSASYTYAGGITGYLSGTVSGSYSIGSISSSSSSYSYYTSYAYTGGIAGYLSGTVSASYSTGDISSTSSSPTSYSSSYSSYSYAGGTAGYMDGVAITGCYATGDISSASSHSSYAGGMAGYADNGGITDCAAANGHIVTSAGGTPYSGRIVGGINSSSAANNFANLSMLVNSAAVFDNTNNGTGKSLAELQTQAAYETAVNGDGLGGLGWEFGNSGGAPVWKMPAGGTGYPIFY